MDSPAESGNEQEPKPAPISGHPLLDKILRNDSHGELANRVWRQLFPDGGSTIFMPSPPIEEVEPTDVLIETAVLVDIEPKESIPETPKPEPPAKPAESIAKPKPKPKRPAGKPPESRLEAGKSILVGKVLVLRSDITTEARADTHVRILNQRERNSSVRVDAQKYGLQVLRLVIDRTGRMMFDDEVLETGTPMTEALNTVRLAWGSPPFSLAEANSIYGYAKNFNGEGLDTKLEKLHTTLVTLKHRGLIVYNVGRQDTITLRPNVVQLDHRISNGDR